MNTPTICLLDDLCQQVAERLDISNAALKLWLSQATHWEELQIIQCLHLMLIHELNPFTQEISLGQDSLDGEDALAWITMNGWYKIINAQPHFAGMSLREPQDQDALPTWLECTIYRDDRVLPIIVREYFCEVQTHHPIWVSMPRRMLRHRTIQQCARLAFGISAPDIHPTKDPKKPMDTALETFQNHSAESRTTQLKELLLNKANGSN